MALYTIMSNGRRRPVPALEDPEERDWMAAARELDPPRTDEPPLHARQEARAAALREAQERAVDAPPPSEFAEDLVGGGSTRRHLRRRRRRERRNRRR